MKSIIRLINSIELGIPMAEIEDMKTQKATILARDDKRKIMLAWPEMADALLDIYNAELRREPRVGLVECNAFAKLHNLLLRLGLIGEGGQ